MTPGMAGAVGAAEDASVAAAAGLPLPSPRLRQVPTLQLQQRDDVDRPSDDWVGAVDRALARIHTDDGDRALRELRRLVEAQAMTVAQEHIRLYQRVVHSRLQDLSRSTDLKVRLACIRATRALIHVDYVDSASRTTQLSFFANFLPHLMQNASDVAEIDAAALTLAHIVRTDFSLSNVIVDTEVAKYLEWLGCRQMERYYHLSVGLRELANAAPGAVLPRMRKLRKALMSALEHPSIKCRQATSLAFRSLLKVEAMDDSTQPEELVRDCEQLILRKTAQGAAANPFLCHGALLVMKEIVGERMSLDGDGVAAATVNAQPRTHMVTTIAAACLKLCTYAYPTYIRVTAVELLSTLSSLNREAFQRYTADAVAACVALATSAAPYEPDSPAAASLSSAPASVMGTPRTPGVVTPSTMPCALATSPASQDPHPLSGSIVGRQSGRSASMRAPPSQRGGGAGAAAGTPAAPAVFASLRLPSDADTKMLVVCAGGEGSHQTASLVAPAGCPNRVREAAFRSLAVILETQGDVFNAVGWVGPVAEDVRNEVMSALETCPPCPGAGACVIAIAKVCAHRRVVQEVTTLLLDSARGLPLCPATAGLLLAAGRLASGDVKAAFEDTVVDRVEDVLNAHRADPSGQAALLAIESLSVCSVDCVTARRERLAPLFARVLQHASPAVRRSAATAAGMLVTGGGGGCDSLAAVPGGARTATPAGGAAEDDAEDDVARDVLVDLLTLGVSDPVAEVRKAALRCVLDQVVPARLDLLASDTCVAYLSAGLADEVAEAREIAIDIAAHAAPRSETLKARMQLLVHQTTTELQCPSDAIQQEQAARMLGHILRAAKAFVTYNSVMLYNLLLNRLRNATSTRLKAAVLGTLSELVESHHVHGQLVEGSAMAGGSSADLYDPRRKSTKELVAATSTIIGNKHTVATRPAARLLTSLLRKGCVEDYSATHPALLASVFESLREGDTASSCQMLELLGVIGAWEPAHEGAGTRAIIKATSPDYDRYVTTKALLDILAAPSLVFHRREALQALQSILKAFPSGADGAKPAPLLSRVLPVLVPLLEEMHGSGAPDVALSEALFRALYYAVAMVYGTRGNPVGDAHAAGRVVVDKYLPRIAELMKACWDPKCQLETLTIIALAEVLPLGLAAHGPWLMPRLVALVRHGDHGLSMRAVQAFSVMRSLVEPFLIPVCACLLDTAGATDKPPDLRIRCMQTLSALSAQGIDMRDVLARVVHALTRICQGVVTPPADARHGVGSEAIRTLCAITGYVRGSDFDMFRRSVVRSMEVIRSEEARRAVRVLEGTATKEDEAAMGVGAGGGGGAWVAGHVGTPLPGVAAPPTQAHPTGGGQRHRSTQHQIHAAQLKAVVTAYTTAHREDDYERWLLDLAHELLEQSPRTVLRACAHVGRGYPNLARELFPPAFSLCWNAVAPEFQKTMSQAVRDVLLAPGAVRSTVLHPLLNLCVFVERAYAQHFADAGERQRPVHQYLPPRQLWPLAKASGNHALALYWLEAEVYALEKSVGSGGGSVETRARYLDACRQVVHINKCLERLQQAEGVLAVIKRKGVADSVNKPETYEDLGWWQRAYEEYEKVCTGVGEGEWPYYVAGMMRCKEHMGDWRGVLALARTWDTDAVRERTARAVSHAAWMLVQWDDLAAAVSRMPQPGEGSARRPGDSPPGCTAAFYRAILAIKNGEHAEAHRQIHLSRAGLEKDVCEHASAIQEMGRGYELLVMLQHLAECEEILMYKEAAGGAGASARQREIRGVWAARLRAMRHDAWHMRDVLVLRSLVVRPQDAVDDWLHYVSVLPTKRAARTLKTLLGGDTSVRGEKIDASIPEEDSDPKLILIYLQHMWDIDTESRAELVAHLERYTTDILGRRRERDGVDAHVVQEALVVHAQWEQTNRPHDCWEAPYRDAVLQLLQNAIDIDVKDQKPADEYRMWHEWALLNFRIALHGADLTKAEKSKFSMSAVKGFVRCIQLSDPPELATQDVLRLLSLVPSSFGGCGDLERELRASLDAVAPKQWATAIPQVLSRLGHPNPAVNAFIRDLVAVIAGYYPQRVLFSLSVPLRQVVTPGDAAGKVRRESAAAVARLIRKQHPQLAEEVDMITTELVKIAVTAQEKWVDHLVEANHMWLSGDGEGMLALLKPLHEDLTTPPTTNAEKQFAVLYERHLTQAQSACITWRKTKHEMDMRRAWALYGQVYARLNDELKANTLMYLSDTTTRLSNACFTTIDVFGTGAAGVTILKFHEVLRVMGSKRRPKQLTVLGSNGEEYPFLLKGQEDLRLDQRVMQVLDLVNTLIQSVGERVLPLVQTFAVVPLSPTAGLIGWVEHAQTFDDIIAEMRGRNAKSVREEIETFTAEQHGLGHCLRVIQRVEALEHTLSQSNSDDIHIYLWLGSAGASEWIERRTTFAHSAALMSMVGYILGLGDRHPGNVMIGHAGKVVHIDFADCFETAMHRRMFPERVPFRLTAMMARAMGIGGVSGTFRGACCKAMTILRKAKQPLMAMLEAFVHDPIVHNRLNILNQLTTTTAPSPPHGTTPKAGGGGAGGGGRSVAQGEDVGASLDPTGAFHGDDMRPSSSSTLFGMRKSASHPSMSPEAGAATEGSVAGVIKRIQAKLDGTDVARPTKASGLPHGLAVAEQVDILIASAQDLENLAQCYTGWCPFW